MLALALGAGFVACSAASNTPTGLGGTSGAAGTAGTGGAPSTGGAAGGGAGGASGDAGAGGAAGASAGAAGSGGSLMVGMDSGVPDVLPDGCFNKSMQATRVPLTLYLLLDRSSSMAAHWASATAGLNAVMVDPVSTGINMGFSFFPPVKLPTGTATCDSTYYTSNLVVDFGILPGNAAPLATALMNTMPNGFGTPIYPALAGALARGITEKQKAPGSNFAVLLVTDGQAFAPPDMCPDGNTSLNALDPQSSADIAAKAFQMYGIQTFVVGLPGASTSFGNAVATAGGTGSAIVVSNVDEMGSFEQALAKVRGQSLGCSFPLPAQSPMLTYDINHVNVRYTMGGSGAVDDLKRSPGCADGQGWDYDDPTTPTKITLCPGVCGTVEADGTANVEIVLGCPTVLE